MNFHHLPDGQQGLVPFGSCTSCASTLCFIAIRRQMLDQCQLGSWMQLSKVYLIHEGTDKEDATASATEQVFRGEGVGQCIGIQTLALVGDGEDEGRAGVFKAYGDQFGGVVVVAVQYGIYGSLADCHGEMEAFVLIQAGFRGHFLCDSFYFADAFHGGTERKTHSSCLRSGHLRLDTPFLAWDGTHSPLPRLRNLAGSFMAEGDCVKQTLTFAIPGATRSSSCRVLEKPGASPSPNRPSREYTHLMKPRTTARVSLTAMLGTPVTDAQGHLRGRLKDVAVATGPDAGKVAGLVLKTRTGLFIVPSEEVMETPAGTLELRSSGELVPLEEQGNYLYLQQDLVDRQIIDIHGRKVVRVNDVELEWMGRGAAHLLRVAEVEVGLRGAFRRVFKGLLPRATLETVSRKLGAHGIPWQFVDVIEVDPARRVKLRIEYERLAEMHPSDLAEILEDLAPAEREAVFTSLDEEVAAETLEEVEPKLQKALLEKLDEERIADIVEEMDPGAAADLLAELPEEQSDAILEEMEPEERQEVEDLLEFDEDSAAGCMTTDFIYLGVQSTVAQAVQALRSFDGDPESVTEVYLLDEKRVLRGAVSLARLVMAQPETRLSVLAEPRVLSCPADLNQNELAELFDKYNLHALPVVDGQNRMVGVVQADHVISFLREKL